MKVRSSRGARALGCMVLLIACAWMGGACASAQEGEMEGRLRGRVRAPELAGGRGWLNTDKPLSLAALRGKIVLLDFWTYGCVNCMHVIPDLKRLEAKYARQLVVIGVHSAKFANEKETENIRRVVLRYELEHPVVNDADFAIWRAYAVRAWPTLMLIDAQGYVAGKIEGEGVYDALDAAISQLVSEARKRGELNEQPLKYALERAKTGDLPLAFPGKVLADGRTGRLFIADSNHNRIVVTRLDGTLITIIGTGAAGAADGTFERATFHRPQGLALDAGKQGDEDILYVADTENHLIRRVDLKARIVTTVAGTGQQSRVNPGEEGASATSARTTALNSPWDLQLVGRRLYVAMAGPHQIWRMNLTTNTISVFAGSGREGRVDGRRIGAPYPTRGGGETGAAFAQPSGLTTDGATLYVADAESNVIRAVDLARRAAQASDDEPKNEVDAEGNPAEVQPKGEMPPMEEDETKAVATLKPAETTGPSQVVTLAGGDLFDFGDEDGEGDAVRLQHPLGVLYVEGAGVFVADTYNHKIKLLDLATHAVKTIAGTGQPGQADGDHASFYEPGGLSFAAGKLYVADTNNHAIRVVDPATGKTSTLTLRGLTPPASSSSDTNAVASLTQEMIVAPQRVAANAPATLTIDVELPAGYHLNESAPQSAQVSVTGGAQSLSVAGGPTFTRAGREVKLPLAVPLLARSAGAAELRAQLTAYYCREDNTGVCRIKTLVWRVPLRVVTEANAPHMLKLQGKID